MISVIIPALNEESTIYNIVTAVKKDSSVSEIIVVDDMSIDNTVEEARKAGATVITSSKLGKGISMQDGLLIAKNEIIVYLDGDVENYPSDIISKLTAPIINNQADFVKSTFEREAGRVTELVAKPLLSILFPELSKFSQPLSGMIAARKELLQKITFDSDYGVDIGLLIDMHRIGARMIEVNIGIIKHRSKQWRQLIPMAREVSRAILKRVKNLNLETLESIDIVTEQLEVTLREALPTLKKMVVFDMDNTILTGRFVEEAAKAFGFYNEYIDITTKNSESFSIIKLIAKLFKGLGIEQLRQVVEKIPLVGDIYEVVAELKKRGYVVGIISDSYDFITNYIKNKIGADFSLANELEFSNAIATGEVKIPSFFLRTNKSYCNHIICKSNAMVYIAELYQIPLSSIIAVGEGENDICMIKAAGIGVSFCSNNKVINLCADKIIDEKSFKSLLEFAK
ncbi:MAG: HAD-IB family phosphatase [Planctomycetota bacterium]